MPERRTAGECGRCGTPTPDDGTMRSMRQERGQTLEEEGEEHPKPPALCQAPRARALHRLRRPVQWRSAVSHMRTPLICAFGRASRHADLSAALHGDRDSDGRGSRNLGQLGGDRDVPGLRPAFPGTSRGDFRRLTYDALHIVVSLRTRRRRAPRPPSCCAAGPPPVAFNPTGPATVLRSRPAD